MVQTTERQTKHCKHIISRNNLTVIVPSKASILKTHIKYLWAHGAFSFDKENEGMTIERRIKAAAYKVH